jgi:hypothetical protein
VPHVPLNHRMLNKIHKVTTISGILTTGKTISFICRKYSKMKKNYNPSSNHPLKTHPIPTNKNSLIISTIRPNLVKRIQINLFNRLIYRILSSECKKTKRNHQYPLLLPVASSLPLARTKKS